MDLLTISTLHHFLSYCSDLQSANRHMALLTMVLANTLVCPMMATIVNTEIFITEILSWVFCPQKIITRKFMFNEQIYMASDTCFLFLVVLLRVDIALLSATTRAS